MAVAAVIENGVVVNKIVVHESSGISLPGLEVIETPAEFDIGWSYEDGVFTPPPVEE